VVPLEGEATKEFHEATKYMTPPWGFLIHAFADLRDALRARYT
jgi:hypothetical protein